ncbi:MAG TPA: cobyric acid synthase [Blastocatellia bacterium]
MTARALMVLGTASHSGKSLTVAALCRILRQDGYDVAPFKAQNMALNSFATPEGHEIGRAQAMQAQAAGIEPHVDMNPILLKPTSDVGSQVVVNGKVPGNFSGAEYFRLKRQMLDVVSSAYQRLAARHDVIVLEGAGSPVEMNLKDRDVVNLKMAEVASAKCILVSDIDRGGVFASLIGTYSLLEPDERGRFIGFLINKFRGDIGLFKDGVDYLERHIAQPCLGVIPYLPNHGIDDEDSVSLEDRVSRVHSETDARLRICVVALPYLSNFTDFTILEGLPDIALYYAREPGQSRSADVLIIPGTKSTIPDLLWLRANGWEDPIRSHVSSGKPLIGICGGFQMLGSSVRDPHRTESDIESVPGLGLLDITTVLAREKITRQATARLLDPSSFGGSESDSKSPVFSGYEIHLGDTVLGRGARPLFQLQRLGDSETQVDGAISEDGRVFGTYLHGLFDSAGGHALLLNYWRRLCGKLGATNAIDVSPLGDRDKRYDALAAHYRRNINLDLIYQALSGAA